MTASHSVQLTEPSDDVLETMPYDDGIKMECRGPIECRSYFLLEILTACLSSTIGSSDRRQEKMKKRRNKHVLS
jgi:hypothetical protein